VHGVRQTIHLIVRKKSNLTHTISKLLLFFMCVRLGTAEEFGHVTARQNSKGPDPIRIRANIVVRFHSCLFGCFVFGGVEFRFGTIDEHREHTEINREQSQDVN
jgi:hypothetical protein